MKMTNRTLFFASCFLLFSGIFTIPALAEVSFSGYAGAKGDWFSQEDDDGDFDPALTMQGYFAGQLSFAPSFLMRLEFSLQTDDILEDGPFSESGIGAHFFIDELSATYIKPFLGNTQYVSFFLGTFEPIGNDVFLQRQFGIKPISSLITGSWLGLRGSTAYPFYGAGGSYILHFDAHPVATGAYLYFNKKNAENENQLNLDWRFATVLPFLSVDFAIGLGAPLSTRKGNENVILLIDTLYLHTGINFLLGNSYSHSLFIQGGISNLQIKAGDKKHKIDSKDIYLLVEPRFVTKKFQAHFTLFSVPDDTVDKFIFIDDTFGLNISVFTDNLYIKNKNITFGIHTTLTVGADSEGKKKTFWSLRKAGDWITDTDLYDIKVSPFVEIPVMTGTLHAMFQAKVTSFGKTWQDAIKLSVGYKSRL